MLELSNVRITNGKDKDAFHVLVSHLSVNDGSEVYHILCVWVVRNHLESLDKLTSLLILLARTYVNTVAASQTVEWRWLILRSRSISLS